MIEGGGFSLVSINCPSVGKTHFVIPTTLLQSGEIGFINTTQHEQRSFTWLRKNLELSGPSISLCIQYAQKTAGPGSIIWYRTQGSMKSSQNCCNSDGPREYCLNEQGVKWFYLFSLLNPLFVCFCLWLHPFHRDSIHLPKFLQNIREYLYKFQ